MLCELHKELRKNCICSYAIAANTFRVRVGLNNVAVLKQVRRRSTAATEPNKNPFIEATSRNLEIKRKLCDIWHMLVCLLAK